MQEVAVVCGILWNVLLFMFISKYFIIKIKTYIFVYR